jgi:hypothetical protein
MSIEEIGKLLAETWAATSLDRFQEMAAEETNGTRFDAVRVDGGRRVMLCVCVTGFDQLRVLGSALRVLPPPELLDWATVPVASLAVRAARESRIVIAQKSDSDSRLIAVVLMAADPVSIRRLESAFGLS